MKIEELTEELMKVGEVANNYFSESRLLHTGKERDYIIALAVTSYFIGVGIDKHPGPSFDMFCDLVSSYLKDVHDM